MFARLPNMAPGLSWSSSSALCKYNRSPNYISRNPANAVGRREYNIYSFRVFHDGGCHPPIQNFLSMKKKRKYEKKGTFNI